MPGQLGSWSLLLCPGGGFAVRSGTPTGALWYILTASLLLLAVLPAVFEQPSHAVAHVEELESKAQAHAEITAQVVQQAQSMQHQAHAHSVEQAKAQAQANALQVGRGHDHVVA